MPEINFEGSTRPLHLRNGMLHHLGKRDGTTMPGGGGDTSANFKANGQTISTSANVASNTTAHDNLCLRMGDGAQLPVRLEGWDIVCLDGHELTVAWVERGGAPHLVGIRNHTTDELQIGGLPYTLKWAGASLGFGLLGIALWLLYLPRVSFASGTFIVITALGAAFLCWRTSRRHFAAVHLTHQQVRAALVD